MTAQFYACDYSTQIGEPQFATAPRTESWILLEYTGAWGAKAYEEAALPPEVRAHLDRQMAQMPNPRLLLIKQDARAQHAGVALYVFGTGGGARFTLGDYTDLVALPLAQIAAGTAMGGEPVSAPIYAVCTNGKRDICCAKHGLPLYQALRQQAGDHVWQCSHIGGHRFAGTCVVLPHGQYYGRLTPDDAPELVRAAESGAILLSRSRGRASLSAPAQAAEQFLREHTGQMAWAAFEFRSETQDGDRWYVTFSSADGVTHAVRLVQVLSDAPIIADSQGAEGKHLPQYRLVAIG